MGVFITYIFKMEYLSTKEASSFLRRSTSALYRYVRFGEITFSKRKGRLLFEKQELKKWVDEGKRKAIKDEYILKNILTNLPPVVIDKAEGGQKVARKKSRRNYGFGSVYQRRLGGSWTIDYRDENGRRIQKVIPHAVTEEETRFALRQEKAKVFDRIFGVERRIKKIGFSEFAQVYLQDYIMISRQNFKSDVYRLEKLKEFFKDTELRKITPLMIERFRKSRLKKGNAKSTCNRYLALLKKLFSVAIEEEFADTNPVKKVKFFSEKDTMRETVLTRRGEERLLEECSERLRPVVLTALYAGMRKSEILGLRWSCVNLTKRVIRAEKTKSGKMRFIPINDMLFDELHTLKKENGKGELVFPYRSVRTAFENARGRAKLNIRFHDLRHTFASRLIERGVDVETVRDLLGHHSITVTQRYTHSNDERKRKAVKLLSEKFDEKTEEDENQQRPGDAEVTQ